MGDIVEGVDREFDAFALRERPALVAFAWSLTGDGGWAEDLAQEALAAAWQGWDRIGGYDRPGAWARRVVANRAVSRGRRTGREERALGRLASRRAPAIELDEADDGFWAAVRELPDRQAQVVALHYLEDRGVAEIAGILGCAEGTVKAHLHRGRLALARALDLLDEEDDQ
jgi:RNA polymerase sigma-70 factor, ECF subfamily